MWNENLDHDVPKNMVADYKHRCTVFWSNKLDRFTITLQTVETNERTNGIFVTKQKINGNKFHRDYINVELITNKSLFDENYRPTVNRATGGKGGTREVGGVKREREREGETVTIDRASGGVPDTLG